MPLLSVVIFGIVGGVIGIVYGRVLEAKKRKQAEQKSLDQSHEDSGLDAK